MDPDLLVYKFIMNQLNNNFISINNNLNTIFFMINN